MDTEPKDSSPDRVLPFPEQQQIRSILNLVNVLSASGTTMAGFWKNKTYPVADFGDSITAISVSSLSKQGQREMPSAALAILRIFRRNEDEKIQTDYYISGGKRTLRIDRHERIVTREEEERNRQESLRLQEDLETMTGEQVEAMIDNNPIKLGEKARERYFERRIGESYVDSGEAMKIIDTLTKLIERQGLQAPE